MKTFETSELIRVTKPTAKKLIKQGKEIYITPCNLLPINIWDAGMFFDIDLLDSIDGFENFVTYFETYNCINAETGKHAVFYVRKEEK